MLALKFGLLFGGDRTFSINEVIGKLLAYAADANPQDILDGVTPDSLPALNPDVAEAIEQIAMMAHKDQAEVINYLLDYALKNLSDLQEIANNV